jgi:hypothetical protein
VHSGALGFVRLCVFPRELLGTLFFIFGVSMNFKISQKHSGSLTTAGIQAS